MQEQEHPHQIGVAPDIRSILQEAAEGETHVGAFKTLGQRRRILRTLLGQWNRSLPLDTEFLSPDQTSEQISKETQRLVEAAQDVRAFLEKYPTPQSAFMALTGEEPQGEVQWTLRPYGICFLCFLRFDASKLGYLGMGGHGAAMTANKRMPEMGKYIAFINAEPMISTEIRPLSEQEEKARRQSNNVGVEHELLHLYTERLMEASRDAKTKELLDTVGTVRNLLLPNPPLNQCEELYREVTRAYANNGIKHEIISYMTSDNGQLDKMDIFNSGMYEIPDPFLLYTMSTGGAYDDESLNELYVRRRQEIGWPCEDWRNEGGDTSPGAEERKAMLQRLLAAKKAASEPYGVAYKSIVKQWDTARRSNIPPNEIADVILDYDFLELPAALDRLIRSRTVLVSHALTEVARRVVVKTIHLFTGKSVTITGPLVAFEGNDMKVTEQKPSFFPPS